MEKIIAVAGSGTMGSGIAFSAAQAGYNVVLYDLNKELLEKAGNSIKSNLQFLLKKNKIDDLKAEQIAAQIKFSNDLNDCKADIIIEAIIEKIDIKKQLFSKLAEINNSETIFASNTSSLSISQIQEGIKNEERVAGLHFFNPANVMKLVEVVKGKNTSQQTIDNLVLFSQTLGKTPVICTDSPGFIVNRVARHFYLEALHIAETGEATPAQIDAQLESAGFKMGPFKLMDMIGMDINLAVSQSLYEAFNKAIRFKPSALQESKVLNGDLGRKTGKGFYTYNS